MRAGLTQGTGNYHSVKNPGLYTNELHSKNEISAIWKMRLLQSWKKLWLALNLKKKKKKKKKSVMNGTEGAT